MEGIVWAIIIIAGIVGFIVWIANQSDENHSNQPHRPAGNKQAASLETLFRAVEETVTPEDGYPFEVLSFQMKGLIPYPISNKSSSIAISLFDDDEVMPMMSLLDSTQEELTRFYLFTQPFESTPIGSGFTDWVSIGYAVKESLVPPRSGQRKLRAFYRFVRPGTETTIFQGWPVDSDDVYYAKIDPDPNVSNPLRMISLDFDGVGYLEEGENAEIAQKMALKLALSMAVIDGDLHESEGTIIKNWLTKFVEDYKDESEKERIKEEMNSALELEYQNAIQGKINREESLNTLFEVGQKIDHYETMELLMDIMAADDEAHKDELAFIDEVGNKLEISPRHIQDMKSAKIIENDSLNIDSSLADQQLGINASMSKEEICKYIQEEFLLWNSRIQAQNIGPDREYAQSMIDMLAEAKIRHCG